MHSIELEFVNSNEQILWVYLLEINVYMDVWIRHALLFPATSKDIYLFRRGKFDICFVCYAIYIYIYIS